MDDKNDSTAHADEPQCPTYTYEELNDLVRQNRYNLAELRQLLKLLLIKIKKDKRSVWMTSYEVQNHLRISKLTLKRYRDTGKIRYVILHGKFLYHYADVENLLIT